MQLAHGHRQQCDDDQKETGQGWVEVDKKGENGGQQKA